MITATRFHDFSAGHRVDGHEGKCALLHGHNYRAHFTVVSDSRTALDEVGRVLDFSVLKSGLCNWLEAHWDHRFLAWEDDSVMTAIMRQTVGQSLRDVLVPSIVWVPFNPTAENMAEYLLNVVGPEVLRDSGAELISVVIDETRKCSASASLETRYKKG